jgi:hypothetical protein
VAPTERIPEAVVVKKGEKGDFRWVVPGRGKVSRFDGSLPVAHHDEALAGVLGHLELREEGAAEGESPLPILARVGVRIYADDPDRLGMGPVKGDRRQAAVRVSEWVGEGDAGVPDKGDARTGLPVGREKGPKRSVLFHESAFAQGPIRDVISGCEKGGGGSACLSDTEYGEVGHIGRPEGRREATLEEVNRHV